ncbi:MAG: enoyl-CoA hydratase-related protein [Chloroflexota bacterium]|nr:enoyl-CoA hydratase-related protein [Chloroflexota bacterium]
MYRTIIYEKKGGVGYITLNHPDIGNALTAQLSHEFADAFAGITADEEVKVVIITGMGKHFCIGSDPTEESLHPIVKTILNIDQPIIAAINGDALGQGLELALACDLRIAADTAHFGLPQIVSAFIPSDGGTQLLPRIIGRGGAMEMILTGETINATRAYEIGLVNKVVPSQELIPTVTEMANEIASRASISLKFAKEAICKGLDLTLEQGLHLEADLYALLQTTEDRVEGIKAFQERRKPQFKGR